MSGSGNAAHSSKGPLTDRSRQAALGWTARSIGDAGCQPSIWRRDEPRRLRGPQDSPVAATKPALSQRRVAKPAAAIGDDGFDLDSMASSQRSPTTQCSTRGTVHAIAPSDRFRVEALGRRLRCAVHDLIDRCGRSEDAGGPQDAGLAAGSGRIRSLGAMGHAGTTAVGGRGQETERPPPSPARAVG